MSVAPGKIAAGTEHDAQGVGVADDGVRQGGGMVLAERAGRWAAAVCGLGVAFVVGAFTGLAGSIVLPVLVLVAGAVVLLVPGARSQYLALAFATRAPTETEAAVLAGPVAAVADAARLDPDDLVVTLQDRDGVTARPAPGDALAVTTESLSLTPNQLVAVVAHELGHRTGGPLDAALHVLATPARWAATALFWLVAWPAVAVRALAGRVALQILVGLFAVFAWLPLVLVAATSLAGSFSGAFAPLGLWPVALLLGAVVRIAWRRRREKDADRFAAALGFAEPLTDLLDERVEAGSDDAARRRPWWRRLLDPHPSETDRLDTLVLAQADASAPAGPADEDAPVTPADLVAAYPWMDRDDADVPTALLALMNSPATEPIDQIRLRHAVELADLDATLRTRFLDEVPRLGTDAMLHPSGMRLLPSLRPVHDLLEREVGLGQVAATTDDSLVGAPMVEVNHRMLRTSMLVIGPPGSGKTHSFAYPVVEHLSQSALLGTASVVVIDPKGDDFDRDGWFDVVIDPLRPTRGLSLFGGSANADIAADRLASALLPADVSDDKAYFTDASKNALYDCLAPYHAAFDAWPSVRDLLALLRADQRVHDRVRAALKGKPDAAEWRSRLDNRVKQTQGSHDPAASLVERLAQLDRPAIRSVLDRPDPFTMADINTPVRVRIALPEAEYPEASRIIARLVVSQFVQAAGAQDANPHLFKGLVIDEAGRYVDDYVARGIQRLRSKNAGLLLLTQTLSDFPEKIRPAIFGSAGCKAVFGGVDPATAAEFSSWFGEQWVTETTTGHGLQQGRSDGLGYSRGTILDPSVRTTQTRQTSTARSRSVSTRYVERARWTPSDIMTKIPVGHSVVALATADGARVGPVLVDHRAPAR
jgi:Zn-dependent protease with chaperone function